MGKIKDFIVTFSKYLILAAMIVIATPVIFLGLFIKIGFEIIFGPLIERIERIKYGNENKTNK